MRPNLAWAAKPPWEDLRGESAKPRCAGGVCSVFFGGGALALARPAGQASPGPLARHLARVGLARAG